MCKICEHVERDNAKENDLMVWWIPQVPGKPFYQPVKTIGEAKLLLDSLAKYDLFQFYHNIKPDFANAGGLEIFIDDEWLEWENIDGYNIDDVDENGETLE